MNDEKEREDALAERMAKRVEEVLKYNFTYFDTQNVPPDVVLSAALSMAATAGSVMGLDQNTFMKLSRRVWDKASNHPATEKGVIEAMGMMEGQVKH